MEPIHLNVAVIFHLLLFLALTLISKLFLVTCNARQCLQADSSVLLQLKRGFTSDELHTWSPGTNCCIWEGVTCDDELGRVISLDLSYQSITSKIDSSLFNLTSLRALNLAGNLFGQKPIPDFGWDKLANLSTLDLSSAGFVGNVPAGISRLSKLIYLDLSYTDLEISLTNNPTFLRNMSNLKVLNLNSVNLSAYMDEWCFALVNSTPVLEELRMDNCSLSGGGCSSLFMLPLLSHVDLGNNELDSSILDSFVNLTLSYLGVADNAFQGFFPLQIFHLRNLNCLDISYNPMLSGSLPDFHEDSNLEYLLLSSTNFLGKLPDTISNLKFLADLEISNCQFSGRLPPAMRNLSLLQWLDLSYNNFSGDVELEFINNFKMLLFLDLSNSGFSLSSWDVDDGSFPYIFSNVSSLRLAACNLTKIPISIKYHQLEVLDLSNNNIHGEISSWFLSISELNLSCNFFTHIVEPSLNLSANYPSDFIDLHSNLLEGPIPALPSVDIFLLDLSNNHFSSFIPSSIFSYLNVTKFFSLANNNLIGEIQPSICHLTSLIILDLSKNMLTGSIPPCLLENAIDLKILNLKGNQFHGVIPPRISLECNLQTINLRDNQLEGLLPKSLSNCQSLMIMDLGNNNLKDTFPYLLGNLPSLRVLSLRSNKFNGLIGFLDGNHQKNSTFSMLHVFDISSNDFSGKLCENSFSNFKSMMTIRANTTENFAYDVLGYFYHFDVLTVMIKRQLMIVQNFWMLVYSIDISNNHFEGAIPTAIGQLTSITVLNMSQNYLTGKISPQLGNLSNLESLDLSIKSLSGMIPKELVSLYFLSYLNLSYNKLVGRIPIGGQFSTFPYASFEGNEGLCCWSPHNTSASGMNNTVASPLSSHERASKYKSYMIVLGVLFGVGSGVCMAAVVVLDVIYCYGGRRWRNHRSLRG